MSMSRSTQPHPWSCGCEYISKRHAIVRASGSDAFRRNAIVSKSPGYAPGLQFAMRVRGRVPAEVRLERAQRRQLPTANFSDRAGISYK
jgi:hypothetical protein